MQYLSFHVISIELKLIFITNVRLLASAIWPVLMNIFVKYSNEKDTDSKLFKDFYNKWSDAWVKFVSSSVIFLDQSQFFATKVSKGQLSAYRERFWIKKLYL